MRDICLEWHKYVAGAISLLNAFTQVQNDFKLPEQAMQQNVSQWYKTPPTPSR